MLPPTSIGKPLKKRASATKAMILQIDAKISRLGATRRDRVKGSQTHPTRTRSCTTCRTSRTRLQ